jgi:thiol-disulfide isomerase/thioredoxin
MEIETPAATARRAPSWLVLGLLTLAVGGGVAWLMLPARADGISAKVELKDADGTPKARLDYVVKDMDGKDVRLADYKGRPLLLNFWATYCGPCKTEIPIFVEMVEKYRDQKLTILGISIDDTPADLRPFVAEYKMNYPVLLGLGHDDLLEHYEATFMIPITWFIKPDGTVTLKHPGSGSREWFEQQIRALFPAGAERP